MPVPDVLSCQLQEVYTGCRILIWLPQRLQGWQSATRKSKRLKQSIRRKKPSMRPYGSLMGNAATFSLSHWWSLKEQLTIVSKHNLISPPSVHRASRSKQSEHRRGWLNLGRLGASKEERNKISDVQLRQQAQSIQRTNHSDVYHGFLWAELWWQKQRLHRRTDEAEYVW